MSRRVGIALLVLSCMLALPAAAAAAPPANLTPPAIDDTTPAVGETLHASGDTWDDPAATVTYQWRRCNDAPGADCADIAGATGAAYTVVADDVGKFLLVRATAANAGGSTISDSAVTGQVPAPVDPPVNSVKPGITGAPRSGETLTAVAGTWGGTSPLVTREWLRCDNAGANCSGTGGTEQLYILGADDVGHTIRVRETATNGSGTETADSDPTAVVVPPAPQNTAPPSIDDTTPAIGETLHASGDAWDDPAATVTYQWRGCADAAGTNCAAIPNATGPSYTVAHDDAGSFLQVRATATNAGGSTSKDSAVTAKVPGPPTPPANQSPPTIAGSTVVGSAVTSEIGTWSGTIPITLTRQWQRCPSDAASCVDIANARNYFYVLTGDDVGRHVRVVVNAFNTGGSASAASALSGPVTAPTAASSPPAAPPPPPTGTTTSAPTLTATFGAPRRFSLSRALAGRLKLRASCTGPCRIVARLVGSRALARKYRVPRTLAKGKRNLAAAGRATVRPVFPKRTRKRLATAHRSVVKVIVEARDGAGKLAARRATKLTLTR